MLERYRIGTRLTVGVGGLLVAAASAFVAAVVTGRYGQAAILEVSQVVQRRLDTVHAMQVAQLAAVSAVRNAGLQTDSGNVNREIDAYKWLISSLRQEEDKFVGLGIDGKERELLDRAIALRQQAQPVMQDAANLANAMAGDEAAKVITVKLEPVQNQWAAALQELANLQRERAVQRAHDIVRANDHKALLLAGWMIVATIGGVLFAVALTRSVTRPLRVAADIAKRIAQGELALSIQVDGRDECAQMLRSLDSMAGQLSAMVRAVSEVSESVRLVAADISQGNTNLSARTERQAASLQQTAATMTQLTETVTRNSSRAASALEIAERTASAAQCSGGEVDRVIQTMTRISESSRRVVDIVDVINGIAFQTNILALNAAVEASRAGEKGSGFAIVASEVRALARRVTEASREVRELINESVQHVEDGAKLVKGLGHTMYQLVDSAAQVGSLVADISAASSEQTSSIRQINRSVHEIDDTTQENAHLVEGVAVAAQHLAGQTERLGKLMRRFRTDAAPPALQSSSSERA